MDGEFLLVKIVDSNRVVETRRCRLVQLPDGRPGALWRGLGWPISGGDTIEVAGPAFPLLPEHPSFAPEFGLIEAEDEAWLVIDGSVTVRDAASAALRKAGVTVLRSGPWLGDPVDGVVGASFIRFIRPPGNDLREVIAKILQKSVNSSSAHVGPEDRIRALTIELIETRAALARAQTEPREAQSSGEGGAELSRVRQENAVLLQENADLQHQLAEAVPARPESNRAAGRLHDEIRLLLASFRPDLRLLRDSLMVVAAEFADRRGFYRAAIEIGSESFGRPWKKIQGASGWWERHISDGQDNSGRLYARRDERSWDVLVSHKSQQSRDIAWLARQRLGDRTTV